jgi:hypothetical protein
MRLRPAATHSVRGLRLLIALVGSTGCSTPQQASIEVRWLDQAVFNTGIEPILDARCASPQCHARPERALSLYAPLRWREDPSQTSVDEPLDPTELSHNYVASCVLAGAGDPADEPALIRKPLGEAGGLYHGGGAVFADTLDADYVAIKAWIVGETSAEGGSP